MKIFRIQDSDGRGPFKPGFSSEWVIDRKDHDNLLSCIQEFPAFTNKIFCHEYAGCGCRTIKQLKRWFTKKEYEKLLKFGYKAVSMDAIRIVEESDTQLIFTRNEPLKEKCQTFKLY